MKTFKRFLEDMGQKPLGNIGETDPDSSLMAICKMAIEDHQEELLGFFDKLARKDNRIREELDDFKHGKPKSLPPSHGDEGDVVIPASADNSSELES